MKTPLPSFWDRVRTLAAREGISEASAQLRLASKGGKASVWKRRKTAVHAFDTAAQQRAFTEMMRRQRLDTPDALPDPVFSAQDLASIRSQQRIDVAPNARRRNRYRNE